MHLSRAAEEIILHIQIAVIGTAGIILALFDYGSSAHHKGQPRKRRKSLLGACHAEINVVLVNIYGAHGVGGGCVHDEDGAVFVSQGSDLTNGI